MSKNKTIYRRVSVDFLLSPEDDKRVTSKYISIRDKDNKEIVSSELYEIGYELEDGTECDEDGNPLE